MKKCALHNLGCKVNSYETQVMQQMMENAGYEIVPFGEEIADVYIINTCSVTNIADRKSRQMIHKARKINPDAIAAAGGLQCLNNAAQLPDCFTGGLVDAQCLQAGQNLFRGAIGRDQKLQKLYL